MQVFYISYNRFATKIIKNWERTGFKYHAGHVNILKYAYRAACYWASVKDQKIAKDKRIETTLNLF